MRLVITMQNGTAFHFPDKHDIQGMIYTALENTSFGNAHNGTSFKYFSFSDFFFDRKRRATLIISSPYSKLIDAVLDWIHNQMHLRLGEQTYAIQRTSVIKPRLNSMFKSGSPIVLYLDSESGEYFSFREHGDISFFMNRLKDNALKKYEFFTGFKLDFDEPLFDEVELRREVAVPVSIRGSKLTFIGSMWKTLIKEDMRDHEDFYYFLMETGLGEKNSLGFGFINPVRSSES